MAEPSASESSTANDSDQDFDPSADMLVNDFDDEHTLDEEEANDHENEEEIDDLTKEGEMPLEELLKLYGYGSAAATTKTNDTKMPAVATNTTASKVTIAECSSNSNSSSLDQSVPQPSQLSNSSSTSSKIVLISQPLESNSLDTYWRLPPPPRTNLMDVDEDSDSEDDDEGVEGDEEGGGEDWRRTIQVGSDYQASVPDGLCRYDDVPAYENEDKLLWDPTVLHDKEVEEYLRQVQHLKAQDTEVSTETSNNEGLVPIPDPSLPLGCHIRDDEQALYLLHQCGHKAEEALRRKRMQSPKNGLFDPMTSWSEEECKNFEEGLRIYGKDFHLVQKNKVRTRSVGELVQFYYYWKKTERHDVFASKWRIEKKKYSLHPGTTDYMDRFLDEQENLALQSHPLINSPSASLTIQSSSRLQQAHAVFSNQPSAASIGNSKHLDPTPISDGVSTPAIGFSNGISRSDQPAAVSTVTHIAKVVCPVVVSEAAVTRNDSHLSTASTIITAADV